MMLVNINLSMARQMLKAKIELTDGNIIIRPCRLEDAAVICEGVRETMGEMLKWAPWCHPDYSMSDCTSWLSSRSQMWSEGIEYDFVIFDTKDNIFLGGCAIDQINRKHNFANLGYWVRSSRTGQGIATAAVSLISRLGFGTLVSHALRSSLQSRIRPANVLLRKSAPSGKEFTETAMLCATRPTTLSCFH